MTMIAMITVPPIKAKFGERFMRGGPKRPATLSTPIRSWGRQPLSQPMICNELNYLSRLAQTGLDLIPIRKYSRDTEHEREQDQTHHRTRGLRVLQGLRPRRRLPCGARHVGSTAPRRGQLSADSPKDEILGRLGLSHLGNVLGNAGFRQRLQPSCRSTGTSSSGAYSSETLIQRTRCEHYVSDKLTIG